MRKMLLPVVLVIAVVAVGAYAWATRHGEIAPIARPDPASFDPALVEQGETLAGFGNCAVCHTAPGGKTFAGGLPLPTPFGVIHTTNITPDPETGIGTWSEAAFVRAMHQGIDREGTQLYPAFPYDFFAKVTTDDLHAIYAYLMTREPVVAEPRENDMSFPFNVRPLLAGWNQLFLDDAGWQPDPDRDEEWNRGAYLVEGLGHCGACHSPRNRFGAVDDAHAYAGARAEGWYVPPLSDASPAPVPWTQIALVNYLIDGWDEDHGIAAGPMRPVVDDLYAQSEDDVFAIAAYVMSLKGEPPVEAETRAEAARTEAERLQWGHPEAPPIPDDPLLAKGAAVFEAQCAQCHKAAGVSAPLALTTSINAPDASNLVHVVLKGIQPPPRGSLDRSMPGRALQIDDADMLALAAFVRSRFGSGPEWDDVEAIIADVRTEVQASPR